MFSVKIFFLNDVFSKYYHTFSNIISSKRKNNGSNNRDQFTTNECLFSSFFLFFDLGVGGKGVVEPILT